MFYSRSANNKINKFHERAIRIVYDNYNSKFEELLTKDSSFTTHHQNTETLEIEMFKIHHGYSQVSSLDLFYRKTNKITFIVYNLKPTFKLQELTLL